MEGNYGEVYPSDNELLNLQADGETGVEYIATGQSPYYLQFQEAVVSAFTGDQACERSAGI